MVTKDYYSLNEVSEILGKSKETLRRWDRDGKFTAVREPISKYRIYKKEQINSILEQLSIDYEDTFNGTEPPWPRLFLLQECSWQRRCTAYGRHMKRRMPLRLQRHPKCDFPSYSTCLT